MGATPNPWACGGRDEELSGTIQAGELVNCRATNSIRLLPGSHAQQGSAFRAYIETASPDFSTIITNAGSNGSIIPSGPVIVNAGGDSPEFTVKADSGYEIKSVKVDGAEWLLGAAIGQQSAHVTFPAVNKDHAVEVIFAIPETGSEMVTR